MIVAAVGTAAGVGTAAAPSLIVLPRVGGAAGVGGAVAVGAAIISAAGTATGVSNVLGVGAGGSVPKPVPFERMAFVLAENRRVFMLPEVRVALVKAERRAAEVV